MEATRPNKTKDPDKFIYSGYGICFDHTGIFTYSEGSLTRNLVIFGADMSRSVNATNRTQNILLLGIAFIQNINDTTIYAEKMYLPNFIVENEIFVLGPHYNCDNSYLSVNGQKAIQFKAKDYETKARLMYLGSLTEACSSTVLNRLSRYNVKDIKFYGNVYDFSVDYSAISNDEVLKIHKYSMKKNRLI